MREIFPHFIPHLVCFNQPAISAELGGALLNEGSTFYTATKVITYELLPSSHRTTGVKMIQKKFWKIKIQLFSQYLQASLLQGSSLCFSNTSKQ